MRINPNQRKVDYSAFAIPLIIAIIFLIILVKILFSWGSSDTKVNNWSYVNIDSNQEKSQIFIYMSWDSKKQIDWTQKMYPTDTKMAVESWEWKISFDWWNETKLYANKLWEVKYNWKIWDTESFSILNWEMWVEWKTKTKFELKNFYVESNQSILSFSQNMVASSVYVLKWEVLVTLNNWGSDPKTTTIWVWQKLSILNNDLTDTNFKPEDKIEPIDDFFKQSDFFNKHNWSTYLNNISQDNTTWTWWDISWATWTWNSIIKWWKTIMITYPEDEATIEDKKLNIEWKINSSNIEKVTLNDKEASIDKENKTFIAKDFELTSSVNNIVYKAYDNSSNIVAKWVLTIYTSAKNTSKDDEVKKPTVTTYPLASKDFKIVEPAENPYKTTDDIVKIAWAVNKWAVKFITINDFRLTKFSQYSSNWYYFANKDYWTMNDWINLYAIKYYWKDDELLFSSMFTIVKETKEVPKDDVNTDINNSTGSITNG